MWVTPISLFSFLSTVRWDRLLYAGWLGSPLFFSPTFHYFTKFLKLRILRAFPAVHSYCHSVEIRVVVLIFFTLVVSVPMCPERDLFLISSTRRPVSGDTPPPLFPFLLFGFVTTPTLFVSQHAQYTSSFFMSSFLNTP